MENSKIITTPFKHGEQINKSRHVTGINQWARSSKAIGTIMFVLGWFTIPLESAFRRDFGQRYFTPISFYVSLIVCSVFMSIDMIVERNLTRIYAWFPFLAPADTDSGSIANWLMWLILFQFVFYGGLYHLFKIKWRNQANVPLHSFDDGTSRFRWLSLILSETLNIIAFPFLGFYWLLIPRNQRRGKPFPKLITDREGFTNVFVEPVLVFFAACFVYRVASFYLFLSGFALLLHAHWKEMARNTKKLDFQDSRIEAELMRELNRATTEGNTKADKSVKKMPRNTVQPLPAVRVQYPKLNTIIEEWNQDRLSYRHDTQ